MRELIIATHNKGKVKEFKQLLNDLPTQIYSLHDFPEVDEIEETGSTFHENAQLKAETIARQFQKPVLADDSGLVVDALNGAPGIYSARYAGEQATDQKNNDKLLTQLKDIPKNKRTARFVAVVALALQKGETIYREGICEGTIAFKPVGQYGFGYDPIFIPKGYDVTMAQLNPAEKNQISHRKRALDKLALWLEDHEHLL